MQYYNSFVQTKKVWGKGLVLRKVFQNTQELNSGKLGPNWERLYRVTKSTKAEAYKLAILDGKKVQWSWNAVHLKKFYV